MRHTVREIVLERAKQEWADPHRLALTPWFQRPWVKKVSNVLNKVEQCVSELVIGDLKNVKDSD